MEDFPKTVVFVRTYNDCSNIYLLLQQKLGDMFTNPRGYPNLADYRRVEMFTRVLTVDKRTQVLFSFSDSESPLKLIVSTSAFGMGVDICDIRRIIHCGLPLKSTCKRQVEQAVMAKIVWLYYMLMVVNMLIF